MKRDIPINLYRKFLNGNCSKQELEMLYVWFGSADETLLHQLIGEELQMPEPEPTTAQELLLMRAMKQQIDARRGGNSVQTVRRLWPRIAAAAAIVVMFSMGAYFLTHQSSINPAPARSSVANTIVPGSNKAMLTLSNGKQIQLTDARNGQLAIQGDMIVHKVADGQLVYERTQHNVPKAAESIAYNTMTTPRGGQYWVTLPDGSKVLLNAASSLRYPTAFNQKERRVELIGEAYFEVAKNPQKPFRVNVNNNQEVEVLGTHFNIKAYADDQDIRTTLLEGSVKLTYKTGHMLLKPGQMAINNLAEPLIVKQADVEEVMAWKNGLFVFNDESIKDVLKIAARWYDIDVEYRGNIGQKKIWGTVSRYKTITELLDNIAIASGIHYKIEGRRVLLMN